MYIFIAFAKQHSVILFKLLWRTSTFLSVREVDCNFKKISRLLYNCITQVKIRKLKHPRFSGRRSRDSIVNICPFQRTNFVYLLNPTIRFFRQQHFAEISTFFL